ncbi:Protein of unknown function [Noviherbaspirillum humi]|uniref:DUF4242 domain-containing protein n=1 Tax=Noviherbaspirillum humi TaxID=1688639 RepID=A0A239M4C3_9BURK|nr:DUF4242 domain-containing protein [Noviherbaspirillum humi]SNT37441.1 Protein of unknown function [Noviherbaspirillum humi]
MKRYIIERNIPGVDALDAGQRQAAAQTSNEALNKLQGKVAWLHSYVVADKTFCVYMAENEDVIREHARLSGFPANKISEVSSVLNPETAHN